jgi:hypothetical protein
MVSTEAGTEARVGCLATGWQHLYARHKPEETPLYPIIEEHAPRFFAELRAHGASLPRFVEAEFEHYLRCGRLEAGFIRVKCTVNVAVFAPRAAPGAWWRPQRTWSTTCSPPCPWPLLRILRSRHSCIPAHHAQWVLSFPWPLRFVFATDPALLARVLGIVTRALSTFLIHRAGLSVGCGAQTGIVTLIHMRTCELCGPR